MGDVARPRVLAVLDRALHGRITDAWCERVEADGTYESFARWLAIEHDLHVTGNTVRTWVLTEQLPTTERTPAA